MSGRYESLIRVAASPWITNTYQMSPGLPVKPDRPCGYAQALDEPAIKLVAVQVPESPQETDQESRGAPSSAQMLKSTESDWPAALTAGCRQRPVVKRAASRGARGACPEYPRLFASPPCPRSSQRLRRHRAVSDELA